MRTLRIEGDGTLAGTTIKDSETGESFEGMIRECRFKHTAGDIPEVEVIVDSARIDAIGMATWFLGDGREVVGITIKEKDGSLTYLRNDLPQ